MRIEMVDVWASGCCFELFGAVIRVGAWAGGEGVDGDTRGYDDLACADAQLGNNLL